MESETSNWYAVLKAPQRGFHDLNLYDETTYLLLTTSDAFKVDLSRSDDDNDDHAHLKTDYEGVKVSST